MSENSKQVHTLTDAYLQVGVTVGRKLGADDAMFVGLEDGDTVGLKLGTSEILGGEVGVTVGRKLGADDAMFVGLEDGDTVGFKLGTSEILGGELGEQDPPGLFISRSNSLLDISCRTAFLTDSFKPSSNALSDEMTISTSTRAHMTSDTIIFS